MGAESRGGSRRSTGRSQEREDIAEELVCVINKAAIKSLGVIKTRLRNKKRKQIIWDQDLQELTLKEKEAYDKWQATTGQEREKNRQEYRIIARVKRRKVRQYNKKAEEKVIKEIEELRSKDPKTYWNKLKKIK